MSRIGMMLPGSTGRAAAQIFRVAWGEAIIADEIADERKNDALTVRHPDAKEQCMRDADYFKGRARAFADIVTLHPSYLGAVK